MILEILKRTPSWVFVLFFILLAYGYSQSKDRVVNRSRITILPVMMIILSLFGVLSAFGFTIFAITSWLAGVSISGWLCLKTANPNSASLSAETGSFSVPGSWFPLCLMMGIFFTKYAVGVILARKLPIADVPAFIVVISLHYGLLSGVFFGRAFAILRISNFPISQVSNN